MAKIDGLEIVMTKQMQKMIDKELKKRIEELKPELATRYEELLNMRNMEADQFNDGFNDARAGKLETDQSVFSFSFFVYFFSFLFMYVIYGLIG